MFDFYFLQSRNYDMLSGIWKEPYKLYRKVMLWFGWEHTQEEARIILKEFGHISILGPAKFHPGWICLAPKHNQYISIVSITGSEDHINDYVKLLAALENKLREAIRILETPKGII